jgi:transposase
MRTQEPRDSLSVYLGYQGFAVVRVRFEKGRGRRGGERKIKILEVRDQRKTHVCPRCGQRRKGAFQDSEPIRLRECSIGDFPTYLEIRPWRVRCCEGTPVEALPLRAGRRHMTVRFFERVAALARVLPVQEVARMADLSWDTVGSVDKESTRLALGGPRPWIPKKLKAIGIDEVSRTGGRVYFTIVTDLTTGRVLHVGQSKGEAGVRPFVERLGRKRARKIRVVVGDLGYRRAIEKFFPLATYLLDRFHVVQWLNEALTKLRRRLFGGAPSTTTGRTLKVKKWLLLSGKENLDLEHKHELSRLLKMNRPLLKAYLLKEEFREILSHSWKYLGALRKRLRRWCNMMSWSQVPELKKVGRLIRESMERIVTRYEHPDIPMGLVEATNGIIANLRRQARGYRDLEYFKLKIYQRCSLENDPWRGIVL